MVSTFVVVFVLVFSLLQGFTHVCTYTHTHACTDTHTYVLMQRCSHICACGHLCSHAFNLAPGYTHSLHLHTQAHNFRCIHTRRCLCMHPITFTCTHLFALIRSCTYTCAYMKMNTYVYMHEISCTHAPLCAHIYTQMHAHLHMCTISCMHTYMLT